MRPKTLPWICVCLFLVLATPPVIAYAELDEPANLRTIGALRTDTSARYALEILVGPEAPYRVEDYYTIEISAPHVATLLDGSERTVIHVVQEERASAVRIHPPPIDSVHERWIDASTGVILQSRSDKGHWVMAGPEWHLDARERTTRGADGSYTALDSLPTGFTLFRTPINMTWAAKILKKVPSLENARPADGAGTIEDVPVLGRYLATPQTHTHAGCSLLFASAVPDHKSAPYTRAWYDRDSPYPLRVECTPERDHPEPHALVTRTHLREAGTPFSFERRLLTDATPSDTARGFTVVPPNGDLLPYSLDEAHAAVMNDPLLDEFHRAVDAAGQILLRRAHFSVTDQTNPGPSHILPADPFPPVVREPTYKLEWLLTYVTDQGTEVVVKTGRPLSDAAPPTSAVVRVAEADPPPGPLIEAARQAKLVPLDEAIRAAQDDGLAFALRLGSSFTLHIGSGIHDGKWSLYGEHNVHTYHDGTNTWRIYDAHDGTLREAGQMTLTEEDGPPEAPALQTATATLRTREPADLWKPTALVALAGLASLAALPGNGLFAVLYAKIVRSKVLDHPRRAAIYDLLRQQPGSDASHIRRELQSGWGTTLHHLGVLEKNHFVVGRRSGRHRRYWCTADLSAAEIRRRALLAEETPRRILHALTEDPTLTQVEVARRLGLARSTVHYHVARLRGSGLLVVGA